MLAFAKLALCSIFRVSNLSSAKSYPNVAFSCTLLTVLADFSLHLQYPRPTLSTLADSIDSGIRRVWQTLVNPTDSDESVATFGSLHSVNFACAERAGRILEERAMREVHSLAHSGM